MKEGKESKWTMAMVSPKKYLTRYFNRSSQLRTLQGKELGLGLSMSYDIIKAYGGELKGGIERGGRKYEFIIQLSVQ